MRRDSEQDYPIHQQFSTYTSSAFIFSRPFALLWCTLSSIPYSQADRNQYPAHHDTGTQTAVVSTHLNIAENRENPGSKGRQARTSYARKPIYCITEKERFAKGSKNDKVRVRGRGALGAKMLAFERDYWKLRETYARLW